MATVAAIVRYVLFCVFFTVGATAVVISILAPEVRDYYRQRSVPAKIETRNRRIRELTARYEQQIAQIRADPTTLRRLEHVTFRSRPVDSQDTVFPQASAEELAQAQKALLTELDEQVPGDPIPAWVVRSCDTRNRRSLFASGVGLLLTTFIFFGAQRTQQQDPRSLGSGTANDGS